MTLYDELNKFTTKVTHKFDLNFKQYKNEKHIHKFNGWTDTFWYSDPAIRKCHLKTIDILEERNLWLLHINIFPQVGYDLPILGCDIVAGPKKISGSFFDFSPVISHDHPMMLHFGEKTKDLSWNKPRELPDWAKQIFSKHMIAAGAVKDEEVTLLFDVTLDLIDYYLDNFNKFGIKTNIDTKPILNKYCINQKMNDKLHKSILAMGIPEYLKDDYVNNVLFEEID